MSRALETQKERRIRARYLVGCDGGSSSVRKAIGAKLEGTAMIQRVQSTCLRAPKLRAMLPGKPARRPGHQNEIFMTSLPLPVARKLIIPRSHLATISPFAKSAYST